MTTEVKQKLASRLALRTAGVTLLLAVVMSMASIYQVLQQLKTRQSNVINSVLSSTLPSFNLATFNYNLPLTQQLAEGLITHPGIASAIVLDSSGLQLAQAGKPVDCRSGSLSLILFNDPGLHIHPLSYDGIPLGKLVVELDRCDTLAEFRQMILLEILYAIFFSVLIALFIYITFYRQVTQPLTRLVEHIEGISTENLETTDLRKLSSQRTDELGVLMNRFAQLLQLLRLDLEKQRHAEATINEYSQRLEDLVSKRTNALTHLNKRLQQTQGEPDTPSALQQRLSTLMQLLAQPLEQLIHCLDEQHPGEAKDLATQLRQLISDLQIVQENACHQANSLINISQLTGSLVTRLGEQHRELSYICDIREDIVVSEHCFTLLLLGLFSNAFLRRGNKNLLLHIRPAGQQIQISISGKGLAISAADFSQDLLPLTTDTLQLPSALGLALLRDLSELMGGELQMSTFDLHGQTLTCLLPLRTRRQLLQELQQSFQQQPVALQISNELWRQQLRQWLAQWQVPADEQAPSEHQVLLTDRLRHGHNAELTLFTASDSNWPGEAAYLLALTQLISKRPCNERQPLRILLVDDNTINRMLCQRYLKNLNIDPDLADNGLHAIELTQRKRFDLILMDCQMPVMDGFEATRQIRRNSLNQNTPIIALTGLSGDNERQNCLAAGMNDFISKPFTQDQIQAALIQWISHYFDHAND